MCIGECSQVARNKYRRFITSSWKPDATFLCRIKCTNCKYVQAELTISNELVIIPHAETLSPSSFSRFGTSLWQRLLIVCTRVACCTKSRNKKKQKLPFNFFFLHKRRTSSTQRTIIARHKIDIIIFIFFFRPKRIDAKRTRNRQWRLSDESKWRKENKKKTRETRNARKGPTTNRMWLIKWDRLVYLALHRHFYTEHMRLNANIRIHKRKTKRMKSQRRNQSLSLSPSTKNK